MDADGAPLESIAALSPDRGQAVLDQYVILSDQIETLAAQMESEGDAGKLAARIIRLALVTPEGFGALHAAGDQPVIVNWGYAVEGQTLPGDPPGADTGFVSPWAQTGNQSEELEPDPTTPEPPPVPKPPQPASDPTPALEPDKDPEPAEAPKTAPEASAAAAEAAAAGSSDGFQSTASAYLANREKRGRIGPVAWLVPLLLLLALAYVAWLLWQPLEPVIVEEELPPGEAADPVPDAQARRDALLVQLEEATRLREGLKGICVALPEPEPEPRPDPAVVDEPVRPPDPPEVAEVEPEPDPEPRPKVVVPQVERVELPPEVPKAEDIPVDLAQQTIPGRPQPTICEPGWTPTQRPEVMVVIDGSGSMSESFPGATSRIDAARRATEEVINNLHKDIRTGLVSFTDCDATSTPRKYRYSERPELIGRVRGVSPTRGTSLANSIRRAGNAAKSGGPATVVVVSDGADTCGGDPCAAARKLKAQKPMLKVNVIDLSGGRSSVLQCVADATGGRVFTPRNASQMNEEMQQATGQPDASQCNG